MKPEQIGLCYDPKVLRLPDGLEVVGELWFGAVGIETLIVSSSVKKFEMGAFTGCRALRQIIFEPGTQLEMIGKSCFSSCGIEQIVIPKSVQIIEDQAFWGCYSLTSLEFEEGSQLRHVGKNLVLGTPLNPRKIKFPEGGDGGLVGHSVRVDVSRFRPLRVAFCKASRNIVVLSTLPRSFVLFRSILGNRYGFLFFWLLLGEFLENSGTSAENS